MSSSNINIRRSVVRVQGVMRGTGFWVKGQHNKIYILTCTHVVGEQATQVSFRVFDEIHGYPEQNRTATVINKPIPVKNGDVTLLEVAEDDIPGDCLPLRLLDLVYDKEDAPGIRSFGFPSAFSLQGRHLANNNARLGLLTQNDDQLALYQLQNAGDVRSGFSGAPVVHTDWGFALGIISEVEGPQKESYLSVSYAIPAQVIAKHFAQYVDVQTMHPYKAWLSSLYDDVVLNDEKGMRLSDIYVEPYYGVHHKCKPEKHVEKHQRDSPFIPQEQSIHEAIDNFIATRDRPLLLLLGFPGQGKTSLVKRLVRDHIGRNVYLVRLRDVSDARKLRDDPSAILPEEVCRLAYRTADIKLSTPNLKDALLVLDGLDELSMQNDFEGKDVDAVVRAIREWALRDSFQVVLTSRYVVDTDRVADERIWCWQLAELQANQQDLWLERYRQRHPESPLTPALLDQYREKERYETLRELITQPILLHLVASLEQTLSDATNRAAIYKKLFDQLIERPWAKKSEGNIPHLEGIGPSDLREAVQDMAHAIFHSNQLYLHKSKLETLPKVRDLQGHLQGKLDLWRSVMVAFYMEEVRKKDRHEEESDRNHDYAIEFLHKSLPEYLCAEKIWRDVREKFADKPRRATNDLEELHDIFRSRLLTNEVTQYLIEIIENDTQVDKKSLYQRLLHFQEDFLKTNFLDPAKGYFRPLEAIRAVFYGWWTVVSHLGVAISPFTEHHQSALVELFRVVWSRDWVFLNLSGANLEDANLEGANLDGANLEGANLEDVNLDGAKLSGANLSDANLDGANLSGAYLDGAYLSGANLEGAYLSGAFLESANLDSANLSGAFLEGAKLSHANLSGANLEGAFLEGAGLDSTDLSGANLEGANLEGVYLDGASLDGASLDGANLSGANLSNANLSGAMSLSIEQLLSASLLYKCQGIPEEWEQELRQAKPGLFGK